MAVKHLSHVGDDRLVTACLEGPSASEAAHLDTCALCTARRQQLETLLSDVSESAAAATDEVFTEERLATQRVRIFQRIAHIGQPGRVIAFPSVTASDARLFRTRPSSRWVAAAAAAGLAIGLLVGRLSTPHRASPRAGLAASARLESGAPALLPAAIRLSDEEFLGQIENAVNGPAQVLRPLHELTPLVEHAARVER